MKRIYGYKKESDNELEKRRNRFKTACMRYYYHTQARQRKREQERANGGRKKKQQQQHHIKLSW